MVKRQITTIEARTETLVDQPWVNDEATRNNLIKRICGKHILAKLNYRSS
jgi:hypothetical protein